MYNNTSMLTVITDSITIIIIQITVASWILWNIWIQIYGGLALLILYSHNVNTPTVD